MPLPQPFPLPPMCDLPENELVYSGERLLLLFLDGKKLSGKLLEYVPEHHEVIVQPENSDESLAVNLDDLKMMALPGSRPYVLSKEAMEMSHGEIRWHTKPRVFEVVFNDGNNLLGKTLGFRFDQNGLFLFPAQEDGGFKISFITRISMKTYNIGPRIGEVLVKENLAPENGVKASVADQQHNRSRPSANT